MKRLMAIFSHLLFFLLASANIARATNEPFVDQFIGSPLLVLVAIIVIDIIAFVYHKIRK
ncbi:MAG: hypothetical protein OEY22_08255 [Candidatus Bathyarchaeota archaeon]|nr:hypothetical protein [Candidatus Bathyarchaeota archaeon]MDH5788003.1 hypothetical protein [Candidatus Bathyarchaeota archaeon]